MSLSVRTAGGVERRWAPAHPGVRLALALCVPLALLLSWPSAEVVWRTGVFFNSDDATRMVEVRDWMAGQAWFDLSVHRMGLPQGLVSHWSRVVDVPVAAAVRLFALFWPPDLAERAARIAYPLALQAGLIAAMAYAGRVLCGARAPLVAGLLIVLGGIGCFQFEPGRIHHHSPQILLLTLVAAATFDSLDPRRHRRAGWAGALLVVSLAIGLENLPFLALVLAVPPLAWVARGPAMRATLLWFAGALGLAAPLAFVATVPPGRYALSEVDAFSLVHLVALVLGGGACALLAVSTPRLATVGSRLLAAALAAAVLAGIVLVGFPQALHGPFYGMDPLLRPFWLDEVQEVRTLWRVAFEHPDTIATFMMPMVVGSVSACVALARTRGTDRLRWIALAALLLVGWVGSLWGIRVAASLQPLALLGSVWAVTRCWERWRQGGGAVPAVLCSALFVASTSLAWALVPIPAGLPSAGLRACTAPDALAPLAALEPGVAFAPIDWGPFLMAHTGLSVLAGPYHRDNAGNHAVIAGFLAPPDAARAIVRASGARYLVTCGDGAALESRAAPAGLAAALAAGRVPGWLVPVPLGPTPYAVYAVRG